MKIRELEVSVISDLHLATHACKPKKILKYLKSIHPQTLVLNGDIIDSWRFSRNYFPKSHLKVIRQLIKMMENGVQIYYISGNHDEFLRKFNNVQLGNLKIVNQLVLDIDGAKTWIFHGDVFDHIIHKSKWLAKFGAKSYGLLSVFNNMINHIFNLLGKQDIIIYKSVKKRLVKEKLDQTKFETDIGFAGVSQGYQTVICGHTHLPKKKQLQIYGKNINYINCGDWVENFTAAEYTNRIWQLYYYNDTNDESLIDEPEIPEKQQLYHSLFKELVFSNIPA